MLRRLGGLNPAQAAILLADLAINMGFFMLIPFISIHVRDNLGLTATIAGTVLAVRMGVQQVLTVVAGPTADLYGYKRVLLLGLLIRSVGFASFALMDTLPGLLVSAVLSGMGGALFSSAERAAFAALNQGADQQSGFAMLYTAQSVGTTLGPLVGSLLLSWDFRLLSVVAGAVYIPIAGLIYFALPELGSGRARPQAGAAVREVVSSLMTVARNRAFVSYCVLSSGFWVISGQINISLSLQAASVTGTQTSVKYLLWTNSLLVIALQYKLSQWMQGKMEPLRQWALGTAIAASGFLVLIPFPGMGGLVACVVLMSLGGMLVRPTDYTMVMGMAPRDSLGSYYGFSALSVALGGSAGQLLGGGLTDAVAAGAAPWTPWVTFTAVGLAATLGMYLLGPKTKATIAPSA